MNIALVTDDVDIDSKMKGYLCLDTRIKSNNISVHSFDEIVPLLFFLKNRMFDYDMIIVYLSEQTVEYIPKIRNVSNDVHIVTIADNPQMLYDMFKYKLSGFVLKSDAEKYLSSIVFDILKTTVNSSKKYLSFEVFLKNGISSHNRIRVIDILFIQIKDGTITLHTGTDAFILKESKLENIAQKMAQYNFMYTNRSHVVNIARISSISGKQLTLDNGEVLEISRRQQKNVQQAFINYLKNYQRNEEII